MELDVKPSLPIAIKRAIGKIRVTTISGSKTAMYARPLKAKTQTITEIAAAIEFAAYPCNGITAFVKTNKNIKRTQIPTARAITFLP
jgi:hypothetical protein